MVETYTNRLFSLNAVRSTLMVIIWYGQSCFKIQSGDLVFVIDPFSKEIGLTPPRFRADAALITHDHYDHANKDTVSGEPFGISGPGEYEVKGVSIRGIETFHDASEGKERGMNTCYKMIFEDIRILHMGDFGEEKIRGETLDAIGDVDILLLPVGGVYTIDAAKAARVVKQIDPHIVIPMHYALPGLKIPLGGVDAFLKEMGAKSAAPQEKLTIKKKDLKDEGKTEIVVLKPVAN